MDRKFKYVTPDNWLEADPISPHLVILDKRDGSIHAVDGRDWIEFVNGIKISLSVPEDIREAFEFSVGAIGYAYFYYPLFTIVSQQIFRVADFAIDRFVDSSGIVSKPRPLAAKLQALHMNGTLSPAAFQKWEGIRRLRNSSTHPNFQENWGHAMSLDAIRRVAAAISALPWPNR